MSSAILDLLKINQNVDYTFIIPLIVIYFFTFWLIVCGWVLADAKKKMKSVRKGVLMAVLNFIFGFPFLMLYLLIRPIEGEDEDSVGNDQIGGVNVPIVNFVGKDGVVMSLELRINSDKVATEKASEMKIDVSFQSEDEQKKLLTKSSESDKKPEIVITETVKGNRLTGISSRIKGKLGNIKKIFKKPIKIAVIDSDKEKEKEEEKVKESEKAKEETKVLVVIPEKTTEPEKASVPSPTPVINSNESAGASVVDSQKKI